MLSNTSTLRPQSGCAAVEAKTDDTDSTDFHGFVICVNRVIRQIRVLLPFSALLEAPMH